MFLKFASAEDRRAYGGTLFLELQYCSMPVGTSDEEIVAVHSIKNWNLSSLYIHDEDMNSFYAEYKDILHHGLHGDMSEEYLDLWGINYYSYEKTEMIMDALKTNKPKEFEVFLQWLTDNPYSNGFYLLGV